MCEFIRSSSFVDYFPQACLYDVRSNRVSIKFVRSRLEIFCVLQVAFVGDLF